LLKRNRNGSNNRCSIKFQAPPPRKENRRTPRTHPQMTMLTPLPNEDATPPPPHRHKGKSKKGGESSSHGGWLDKFTSYTSNKSDWLKNFVTSATKKHERSVKLMETQERICLEEEYDNDLKKFTKSHEHLSGDMLELVLARKREIAAKHGWTCNF